jgi:hypothetical protein
MATRFWSVVIDTPDPGALARWWADALGWPLTLDEPDEVVLDSGVEGVPLLDFVLVDDPKVVKDRVHLDLASASAADQAAIVERLLAAGASRADIGQRDVPWVVLRDPDGNEFCVLEPRERYRDAPALAAVVADVADPAALADFWVAATGWSVVIREPGHVALRRPGGAPPDLDLLQVPDAKVVKNRLHLDVAPWAHDDRDTEVARLEALGAKEIDVGQGPDVTWRVLADPEGNEFCVLRPR